jgi:LPS export ABC transporter protein LptC
VNIFQRRVVLLSALFLLLSGPIGCTRKPPIAQPPTSEQKTSAKKTDNRLTFNDFTLEGVDAQGKLLWVVNAKQVTYSKDKKLAVVHLPKAEWYYQGKLVFQIEAQRGEVLENGKKITFKEKVIATDLRDKTVVSGDSIEWFPQKETLIVRGNIQGKNEEGEVTAQEARLFREKRRMELQGEVVMKSKQPPLQIATERLVWEVEKKEAIAEEAVQIDRYEGEGDAMKLTDRAVADRAQVDLEQEITTLQPNAQLTVNDPPIQVTSNELVWDLKAQTINSKVPVRVFHSKEQVKMTGNQGWINLTSQQFQLSNGIEALAKGDRAQLIADKLTWNIPQQAFVAEGNVTYRQVEPAFNLTGPKAEGKLAAQTFVISGGRVVTEIIP